MNAVAVGNATRLPVADKSVQLIVCSPPFWALRRYPETGSIGHEATFEEYLDNLRGVARECWRVLRDDGLMFWEIGDAYAGNGCGPQGVTGQRADRRFTESNRHTRPGKPKSLMLMPARVAIALEEDGWYLRCDIPCVYVWHRPNPMPESVTDRPTRSHSYVFMFSKRPRYFSDMDAVRQANTDGSRARFENGAPRITGDARSLAGDGSKPGDVFASGMVGANVRSFWLFEEWVIPTQPLPLDHFAAYPVELARRCIAIGTSPRGCCPKCRAPWVRVTERGYTGATDWKPGNPEAFGVGKSFNRGDTRVSMTSRTLSWSPSCTCDAGEPVPCIVLDPFAGSGTTLATANSMGRIGIGVEIAHEYAKMARDRVCYPTRPAKAEGQGELF